MLKGPGRVRWEMGRVSVPQIRLLHALTWLCFTSFSQRKCPGSQSLLKHQGHKAHVCHRTFLGLGIMNGRNRESSMHNWSWPLKIALLLECSEFTNLAVLHFSVWLSYFRKAEQKTALQVVITHFLRCLKKPGLFHGYLQTLFSWHSYSALSEH